MRSGHPDAAISDNVALTSFGGPRRAGQGEGFSGFTLVLVTTSILQKMHPYSRRLLILLACFSDANASER